MRDKTTAAYQLRAARQRLRGIEAEMADGGFSFERLTDRHDTQEDIKRLAKQARKEEHEAFNEQQFMRLQDDLFTTKED